MSAEIITCDRCGSSVQPGASVCSNCGAPLGGVDPSVTGVPPQTVRSDASIFDLPPAPDMPSPGTPMPLGGQPSEGVDAWQYPPPAPAAPAPTYAPLPPSAGIPAKRSPWLWIIGCCLGLVLLACLLAIGLGAMILNGFQFS